MSPDSDVAAYARSRVDIDMEHRLGVEHIGFVTRPPLFCAACGSAVQQHVFGAIRREVWCCQTGCLQEGKRLNIFDPVLGGVPHT